MPFKKGKSGNPSGRQKGVANKSTELAREAVAKFVDNNAGRLEGWLDKIAEENPKDAFDCVYKLLEYHIPKLQRAEVEQRVVDKDGEDIHAADIKILKDSGFIK